jgi:hypothetical protein
MKPMLINAIISLVPGAQVSVSNGSEIVWHEPSTAPVTEAEISAELARLQAAYDAAEYQRKRAAEYPPMSDYLDGVVKGDQAQIDAYIAACQAVKAKYPKPV